LSLVVGVLVGGEARRMGGTPKGLLRTPGGERLLDRTLRLARRVAPRVVLVGKSEPYDADVPRIADAAAGCGPLAGLAALLEHASSGPVIALACDMPFVNAELLARLATTPAAAAALAPRRDGRWEPLFARFDAARALPVARARLERRDLGLQEFLGELGADELPLSAWERTLLSDWDCPEDIG
jgi:molybdenum cofactor guanylyltransferase